MPTTRLKGPAAGNFFASLMVDSQGEKALDKCAKGSPMYKAVKAELERKKEAQQE